MGCGDRAPRILNLSLDEVTCTFTLLTLYLPYLPDMYQGGFLDPV